MMLNHRENIKRQMNAKIDIIIIWETANEKKCFK